MEKMEHYDDYVNDMDILSKIVSALEFLYDTNKKRADELFYELVNEYKWKYPMSDMFNKRLIELGDLIHVKKAINNMDIDETEDMINRRNNLNSDVFLMKNTITDQNIEYESYDECMKAFSEIDAVEGVSIYKKLKDGKEIRIF